MLKAIEEFPISFKYNPDYLSIIVYSYVFFMSIFTVFAPRLSSHFFSKTYNKLTNNQKVEWNCRITSTVFSLIVSLLCIYILIVDKALSASPLIYDSDLVKTNISIVIGYILSDVTVILFNYKIIGDFFTLFHHFLSFLGYSNALTFSVMPYFANMRLIVEFSTPLVNMRWFLYACGYQKDSLHFFLNGISMTLVFFLARILTIPVYWFKVYTVLDSPIWATLKYFRHLMIFTCFFLDIINLYWFNKMFKGALIVWSTNWKYYEKHHKTQQLEKISFLKAKLFQSTINGLSSIVINPSKYIAIGLIEKLFSLSKLLHNDADSDDKSNLVDSTSTSTDIDSNCSDNESE